MRMLHITNGTAVIDGMRAAGIRGRIVPWNDVLHEGPVPAGLNVAALRHVRAEFIATGNGPYAEVEREFAERDAALEGRRDIDEIVLWFEHDLYDQLQLIQVLDRLPIDLDVLVTAVPGNDYLVPTAGPGNPPSAHEADSSSHFLELFAARREVTSAQRLAARDAWDAFRSPDPRAIVDVLDRVTVLPHLAPALRRHLQQFPSLENGLSRTEQQTLEAIDRGVTRLKDVYVAANHEREEAVFMGDLAFLFHIRPLIRSSRPLMASSTAWANFSWTTSASFDEYVSLTDDGRRVLNCEADRVTLCGIDRWLGGVHLTGNGPMWRWDAARTTVRQAVHRRT